ncbi:MAG: zinc ribbon domain-containing protein [Nanoarchaeota archaeon]|nr:zinc ribbon domain-containing protein [Nanoarchaeota archaeon]MCG2718135.1 zinc ribbon domain-containing protein [Nanoarchaeota archaeon]
MKCKQCGTKVSHDDFFCPECGTKLREYPEHYQSRGPPWNIILFLIVFAAIIIFAYINREQIVQIVKQILNIKL